MPEPAPPTSGVPLAALLARADLGLRRLAGPDPDGVLVHGAHTSELPDPRPYLLGGELLLTAGVQAGRDEFETGTSFDAYVQRVVAGGAVALGFGVAPVHDTVPPGLVAACDLHGLPLVEVPPHVTFSGIARAVWELMAQARHAELRRVTEAQRALATAAARPGPVRAVLRQLAQRTGGYAVAIDPDGAELDAAGTRPAEPAAAALTALTAVVRPRASRLLPAPASAADTVADLHLSAYALTGGGALGLATPSRASGDHTIAGAAVVLLSLLAGAQRPADDTQRADALVRLLLGGSRREVAEELLGAGQWKVVHARTNGPGSAVAAGTGAPSAAATTGPGTPRAAGAAATPGSAARAAGTTRAAGDAAPSGTAAAGPRRTPGAAAGAATSGSSAPAAGDPTSSGGRGSGVVVSGPDLGTPLAASEGRLTRAVFPADQEIPPYEGCTLGISAPVPAADLPLADAQAAHALTRARATRAAVVRHGSTAPALTPLAAHPALTETLRTWLSVHGNWENTAAALSVHRNTVRQRIARCAELLDADLNDPDTRMELWFALRHP